MLKTENGNFDQDGFSSNSVLHECCYIMLIHVALCGNILNILAISISETHIIIMKSQIKEYRFINRYHLLMYFCHIDR